MVERFSRYVYAIAVQGFRLPQPDAEDVFQEVFLRVYDRLDTLRDDEAFRPWIAQLTRRLCLDRAQALRVLGGTTFIVGNFEEGTRFHEQALAEFERLNDEPAVSHLLFRLAVEANRSGQPERARVLCEQARSRHRSSSGEAQVLSLLGDIAFAEGRGQEALDLLRESARLAGDCGFRWWRHHALQTFAEYALKLGKPEEARVPAGEALAGSFSIGDQQGVVYSLSLLAWVATEVEDDVRAGRLWGSIEAEADRAPIGQWEGEREVYSAAVVTERPGFERGRSEGRRLSLEEAVEYALDSID